MKRILMFSFFLIAAILFIYYLLTDYPRFLLEILPAWCFVILFWMSCVLLGARVDSGLRIVERIQMPMSCYFFLGSAIILAVLIILLFTNFYYSWVLIVVILLAVGSNAGMIRKVKSNISMPVVGMPHNVFWVFQGAMMLLAASTPPYFYDSLMYQLMMPSQFLRHHGFVYFPDIFTSSFPMNMNLFFGVALAFNVEMAAQLLSYLFALMTGIAIAEFLYSSGISGEAKHWSFTIFFTTPVVGLAGILPAVDLGLCFYSFISFVMLYFYFQRKENPVLYLSAISAGIALGIKYTFIAYLSLMLLSVILLYSLQLSFRERGIILVKFLVIAVIVASPWFIKNLVIHGDPFYPYFTMLPEGKTQISAELISTSDITALIKNYLHTPVLMNFKMMGAAGLLGYLFLGLLPWLIFAGNKKEPIFRYVLILSIAGLIAFLFTVHFIRYFLPVLPFLSILYALSISAKGKLSMAFGRYIAVLLICMNIFLFFQNASWFKVFNYSLGIASKEEFLNPLVNYYKAAQYLEKNAPADIKILLVGEGRMYYFKQECFANYPEQPIIIEKWIKKSGSLSNFLTLLRQNRVGLVLFNHSEMKRVAENKKRADFFTLSGKHRKMYDDFYNNYLELIYEDEVISVYKINYRE